MGRYAQAGGPEDGWAVGKALEGGQWVDERTGGRVGVIDKIIGQSYLLRRIALQNRDAVCTLTLGTI